MQDVVLNQDELQIAELGTTVAVQGVRLLIKAVSLPEKSLRGLYLPEEVRQGAKRGYNIGRVIGMGPQAYTPEQDFGGKPFCKLGDWVWFSPYDRGEITIKGHLCFIVPDSAIGVVLPSMECIIPEC